MGKIVIGLCGKKGAGKETVTYLLKDVIYELGIYPSKTVHVFSKILEKVCLDAGILPSRPNLQHLPIVLKREFPGWTLAQVMQERVEEDGCQLSIVDGMRLPEDLSMIQSFSPKFVVYIETEEELRFERIKKRKQYPGETELTWEKFTEQEKAQVETHIENIAKAADATIYNSGSMEDLKIQIQEFVIERFLPKWLEIHNPS